MNLDSHRACRWPHRTARLALCAFLSLALGSALSLSLVSCDGKKAGKGGSDGDADAQDPQQAADDLLEKAKKLGFAKGGEDYDAITKLIDDGKKATDDGKEEIGSKKLKQASKRLQAWMDDRKAVQDAVKKTAEARTAAVEAKKAADASKAQQNSPDIYKLASESLTSALSSLEKPASVKAVQVASRDLARARDLFEQARQSAGTNEGLKKQAETEKQEMLKMKEKARTNGAADKAESQWLAAEAQVRDAETFVASGDYRAAADTYRQAAGRYQSAYKDSVDLEQYKKDQLQAQEDEQKQLARLEQERVKEAADRAAQEKAEVIPKPKPKDLTAQAPSIFLFEGFDPTKYPQDDADAEDEALLLEHIRRVFPKIDYDPATAAVTIDYAIGADVKNALKDDPSYKPLQVNKYISFEPPVIDRKIEIQDPRAKKAASPYSFTGNTQGVVAFPVPFRYYVRAEYKLSILTTDPSATFDCLLMYDRKKSQSLVAEWLKVGVMKGGVPKVAPLSTGEHAREYSGPADRWFPKTHEVPMLVEYRMPDPDPKRAGKDPLKSGLFTVTFEVGDDIKGATNTFPYRGLERGLVGFQWSRVKFEVRSLQITGILDKKAAADILREKLKLPKKGAKVVETKEKSADKGAGGDPGGDGNNDGSDPTADDDTSKKKSTPEKAKKGFDF